MQKSTISMLSIGLGALTLCAPLAGNAYYCSAHTNNNESVLSTLDIKAKSCVLMDKASGKVLLAKNENESLPMASMTKMMTLLLVMEEIDSGRLNLNDSTRISEYAASMEGSECFLDAGKDYKISELIKSVVVASANDSTVALAECVSGSEEMFTVRMNERAIELGLTNTKFKNSTGLDESGHKSSARDMAILIKEVSRYEILEDLSKVWMFDMEHSGGRVTNLTNTNRLIRTNPDIVFAKTGHTDGAGYCITALGERDGMELIACVMGEPDSKTRFSDATKLLNYGFSNYSLKEVVDGDVSVGKVTVKNGKIKEIDAYSSSDINLLVVKNEEGNARVEVNLLPEIDAPVKVGDILGEVKVYRDDEIYSSPVESRTAVEERGVKDIMQELMN